MGGIGSGARRSTRAGDVEDALAFDIRALRRLGAVEIGECVITTIRWPVGASGGLTAHVRADLSDIERGGIVMVSVVADKVSQHRIAVEPVASSFGGWRCYMLCPATGRRCEVLYYFGGRFASRHAHRLSYSTQNMSEMSRAKTKARRLRDRLMGAGSAPRPRGRNRMQLAERTHDAERNAKTIYFEALSAKLDRGR